MRVIAFTSALGLALVTIASLAIAHGEEASPAMPDPDGPTSNGGAAGATKAAAGDPEKEPTPATSPEAEKEKKKRPWRGSTLIFDQSVTTQTVGLGTTYQSADNIYEWWFAFKPRYVVYEGPRTTFSLSGWTNLYLEMTNSDITTTSQEPVVGPTSVWANLSYKLIDTGGYKTSFSLGPRLTLPTDQASRDSGMIVGMGANGGLSQSIPLAGKRARAFNSLMFDVSGIYSHPLNRATSPVNSDLNQLRQDAAGRTFPSDQLRAGMNVQHTLAVFATAGLQITPKLGLGFTYVLMNSWVYTPKDVPICVPLTGCVEPLRVDDPQTYRLNTWVLASFDYEATDELSVSLGYYNLSNQIGPDGQRRSPLWSPDARIFFTLTGNLDAIYQRIFDEPTPAKTASVKP